MAKIYLAFTWLLLWGCQQGDNSVKLQSVEIPDIKLETTHKDLKQQRGVWFYQNKPFSGTLVEKHPSGQVKSHAPYYKGKKQGLAKGWYPNGQRWFERPYEQGRKHGTHKVWWQNGQLKQTAFIKQGMYEGNVKAWFHTGKLYRDYNYKKGKEAGHQRMWKPDGRIKANYVVENGRKYGLTGVKNCKSAAEKKN